MSAVFAQGATTDQTFFLYFAHTTPKILSKTFFFVYFDCVQSENTWKAFMLLFLSDI